MSQACALMQSLSADLADFDEFGKYDCDRVCNAPLPRGHCGKKVSRMLILYQRQCSDLSVTLIEL